jgi:ribosomal-protein-alanine N-acetyltransferase
MDREPFRAVDEAREMIASITRDYTKKTAVNWAITLRGADEMIGYVGFWRWMKEHSRAEIAYALLPHYWGKGIMAEAFKEVTRFGFEEMGLHSIEANVNPGNMPSIKLLEKFHFKREAYFKENIFSRGKFCDSAIYSLLEYERIE